MSISSSLFAGISGMQTSSIDLAVIGDNVANANTVGFKRSRTVFEDLIGGSALGGAGQLGLGSSVQSIQRILTQGALSSTGVATDVAISGAGFFVLKDATGQDFYTRAGQFSVNKDGVLVNPDGLRVQGFTADERGNISGNVGDIQVGAAAFLPQSTTEVTLRANLDSETAVHAEPFDPTSFTTADETSDFQTTTTVFDSLGQAHDITVFFRKTGDGEWDWHAVTDGSEVDGGNAGEIVQVANGSTTFNERGEMATFTTENNTFTPRDALEQTINFNFGDPLADGGTGVGGITQFAAPNSVSFLSQDGFTSGDLSRVTIDNEGNVIGVFSNGQNRPLGRVALADFDAADQLARAGGNLLSVTTASGPPNVGEPGIGGFGQLASGALEQSNVDVSEEFVRMILAQRQFQSNAKTVTTADQLLQELIQLKR